MKQAGKKASSSRAIALALTWDGARWPVRTLPPKARGFLANGSRIAAAPSARAIVKLFADDKIREIRICWVPCLKGGKAVLSEPFITPAGTRIGFKSVKTRRFGDILGIVYRRNSNKLIVVTNLST
jgi:hypothetical protein